MHFPYKLNLSPTSGSGVRPLQMLEGFRDAGIDIEVISGTSRERKKQIQNIKRSRLLNHIEWLYIESSTMPMALTDPDHLPRHPWMDAVFWTFARSQGVPVGLFYRDVHWRFPQYDRVPLAKRLVAFAFYHVEWYQIERSIDHLFLPSIGMNEHLLRSWPEDKMSALPPGCLVRDHSLRTQKRGLRSLLYVGGISPPLYDLRPLFNVMAKVPMIKLTICCRPDEWTEYASMYGPLRSENVRITHCSGSELEQLYNGADAIAIIWGGNSYLEFAMPVKLFEAIGWGKPIITSHGTATARFVKSENVGWVTHSEDELVALLRHLATESSAVEEMAERVRQARLRHTWKKRAETIDSVLSGYRT